MLKYYNNISSKIFKIKSKSKFYFIKLIVKNNI